MMNRLALSPADNSESGRFFHLLLNALCLQAVHLETAIRDQLRAYLSDPDFGEQRGEAIFIHATTYTATTLLRKITVRAGNPARWQFSGQEFPHLQDCDGHRLAKDAVMVLLKGTKVQLTVGQLLEPLLGAFRDGPVSSASAVVADGLVTEAVWLAASVSASNPLDQPGS